MDPSGKISRAGRDDGIVGKIRIEIRDDRRHVDVTVARDGFAVRDVARMLVLAAHLLRPFAPRNRRRREAAQGKPELRHSGVDHQIGLIHAAQLVGIGMNVNQALLGTRNFEQRVALRDRFGETRADGDDEVRLADARRELRHDADSGVARIDGRTIVDAILPAKTARRRNRPSFEKLRDVGASCFSPAASTENRDRTLRLRDHLAQRSD